MVNSTPYGFAYLAAVSSTGAGERSPGFAMVQEYLKRFGYIGDGRVEAGLLDDVTGEALVRFQRFFGLPETGVFDETTREAMMQPRCGHTDPQDSAEFATTCAWNRRNLTFAFDDGTADVAGTAEFDAIRSAIASWRALGRLTFTEVAVNNNPDIRIGWRPANDPDHSMVGGVLAHADFPPGCGVITNMLPKPVHFDDTEHVWSVGAIPNAFDIETVALHELGHIIGLAHSSVPGAVMLPTVAPNITKRMLTQDDIDGHNRLYPSINPFPNWQALDNNPSTVALAAEGNNLYQLHNTGWIFRYTGTPMTGWQALDNNPRTKNIVASGGNLYQRHVNGWIFKYTGTPMTGWQALDNNPSTVALAADGNNLYQLHNTGWIFRYTGTPMTGWQALDNNPRTKNIVASGGNLYQRHVNGWIFKYTGTPMTGWQALDNNPSTVALAADGNNLYQLHNTGWIFRYTGTPMTGWQALDNNPRTKNIVASGGNLYQRHINGWIFKYTGTPMTGWQPLDGNPATATIEAGGTRLYQQHNNGWIFKYTG